MKCCVVALVIHSVLSFICQIASADLFSAIIDLEPLLDTEEAIIKTLDKYFEFEEERLDKLRRIRSTYEKLHRTAKQDVGAFLLNPVNAFLLVKRLTSDWQTAGRLVAGTESKALIENVTTNGLIFPDDEDLNGAAAALMRLQDTYLLETAELAQGKIQGATTSSNLTAEDCFELGYQAYKKMDYYHSVLWFKEAYNQLRDDDTWVTKTMILEYLAHSHFMKGEIEQAVTCSEEVVRQNPSNAQAIQNLEFYNSHLRLELDKKKGDTGDEFVDTADTGVTYDVSEGDTDPRIPDPRYVFSYGNYEKLCRGERLKSLAAESALSCQYVTNNSSFLLLQPLKEEVLNLNPRIVVYHNVISDDDTDLFKNFAIPLLNRATVSLVNGVNVPAHYRVSKSAWLPHDFHPRVLHASRIVQEITGLTMETAEDLHVITYGIGGHYEPHLDYRRDHEVETFEFGNRIATWIYYLSDVEAGGSTVFPDAGVEVKPEKGSAALWYNLKRNGKGVEETMHAACPVLAGTKWVGNLWLHEQGQEFRRPCTLNPLE